jgi:serine/threonine protein kinase
VCSSDRIEAFLRSPAGKRAAGSEVATATALAEAGLITRWQGKRLWDGYTHGFVLDDRYVLLDHVGRGGMGSVYKARHNRMDRTVALKVVRHDAAEKGRALERFHREVAASSRLNHPNLLQAYDVARAGDAIVLVLEYVAGPNLRQLVEKEGPLPVPVACDLVRQAALGLEHAHRRGMIHRDIKPSNILLMPNDSNGLLPRSILMPVVVHRMRMQPSLDRRQTPRSKPSPMNPNLTHVTQRGRSRRRSRRWRRSFLKMMIAWRCSLLPTTANVAK